MSRRSLLIASLLLALPFNLLPQPAQAAAEIHSTLFGNVAIDGYDPVAYHLDGVPTKGSADYSYDWHDAEWRFASADHRDRFIAEPERFAPAYGGWCAWAVATKGEKVGTDPEAFSVVDGRLFLNYDKSIRKQWDADRAALIERGDQRWPGLRDH